MWGIKKTLPTHFHASQKQRVVDRKDSISLRILKRITNFVVKKARVLEELTLSSYFMRFSTEVLFRITKTVDGRDEGPYVVCHFCGRSSITIENIFLH